MKRIWIDVDDGLSYNEALALLMRIDINDTFIKGIGVEDKK
jgi:hypothetical protein